MTQAKDPKIQLINDVLQFRGFKVEDQHSGIRVHLEAAGFKESVADIYALKSNPEEIRARLSCKASSVAADKDTINDIHKLMREGLLGVASLEEFHAFGQEGEEYIYYTHVLMEEEPTDVIHQQVFAQMAMVALRGVDAKTFRKSLDTMGLPRSSLVRLALTRIFRDSSSAQELVAATVNEASLIVEESDREAVRSLRENNEIPFLVNLIHLLWDEVIKHSR